MLRSLLFAFVALTASGATISYSPPVGGSRITIEPGTRFSGMPFVNPAAMLGAVASSSGNVITLSNTATNMATALTAGTAYYVELTSGPEVTHVGDRFEVDVTATIASANHTITIAPGASTNTLANLPAGIGGYTLVVRPHVTLGQLFGTKSNELMHGSTVSSSADQVVLFNPATQGYSTYFYLRNSTGSLAQWTLIGGGSTNRDNTIIPPGVGLIVHRNQPTPVTLIWKGEIRRNSFVQPLVAGLNLVAEPLPISRSFLERAMTHANGIAGATVSSSADQVLVPTGSGYHTYFLLRNSSGTLEQWTLIGGGSTNHNNAKLFTPTGAVFIRKSLADPDYSIPYSLNL